MDIMETVADLPIPHEDGSFVSARIDRVIEAIKDYDPNIEVQWIPPRAREEGDNAFRLLYTEANGMQYVMFFVKTEDEFDERVLERIWAADQQKQGKQYYSDVQLREMAQRNIKKRKWEDSIAEANDIAAHVFRSHKNTYKVNKELTIRDYGGGDVS